MLALQQVEEETGPLGISRVDATNPANQHRFVARGPVVDWAEQALSRAKDAYYKRYDTDPKNPIDRSGHLWSVQLKNQ